MRTAQKFRRDAMRLINQNLKYLLLVLLVVASSGCAAKMAAVAKKTPGSYAVNGKTYRTMKAVSPGYMQNGMASWYGPGFHGRKTASGEVYNMNALTAAHNVLPLNTIVRVTNLANKREVIVRINDRGPFVADRVLDLSLGAAQRLGMVSPGTVPVRLAVLGVAHSMVAAKSAPVPPAIRKPKVPNPFYSKLDGKLVALKEN